MRSARFCVPILLAGLLTATAVGQQGFSDQLVVGGWDQATGVTFDANGRGYVWEKAGKVWIVENGVKSAQPLIDISEEVGNWRDYGLLGFALDPNFLTNGRFYLSYVVDYHHLRYFGTPQYNPNANEFFVDTIGRITRYTANSADGFHSVLPNSRFVMSGETMGTGNPITHESHGNGTLLFADDGTLIASVGDGASFDIADTGGPRSSSSNTALQDGILTPQTDVGALRAQQLDSLSGKILRIDPNTGDGIPSNPFYDPAHPHSARSRVWALGMRNPFRICIKPGSGNPNPAAANPGTLFVGDVGWSHHEELSIIPTGGLNLGWPLFEGLEADPDYTPVLVNNQFAPNPLFGTGGCTQSFFHFQDLLKQEVIGSPSFPNPCNASAQIAAGTPRFEHTRPIMDWGHGSPTRVATFNGSQAAVVDITDPASPIIGQTFGVDSSASIGGCWYNATAYPPMYQNSLFFADFTGGWIYNLAFNAQGQPSEVRQFTSNRGFITCVALHPTEGCLYYIQYTYDGVSNLRRIRYGVDPAPTAVGSVTPQYAPLPATVNFSSAGSSDPDGFVTYLWNFGDGTPSSNLPNPSHTFDAVEDITASGTIVAKVMTLNPPHPLGIGNWNPEVIRDGVYPPINSYEASQHYDTYHDGDQGLEDWIGYTFSTPREVRRVLFQEGIHYGEGGWFDVLGVQVRVNGVWVPVSSLSIAPDYPAQNDNETFDTYWLSFAPVMCTGVRLDGVPGGSSRFISVGELRVFATATPAIKPLVFNASLTVTDNAGQSTTTLVPFNGNNTPPQVTITSPPIGAVIPRGQSVIMPLTATVTDTEQGGADLHCSWQIILHHDQHTHPEPPVPLCETEAQLNPHGSDEDVVYYEARLTVTDSLGLATVVSRDVLIGGCDSIDFNHDDIFPDTSDIDEFLAVFAGGVCSNDPNCGDIDFNNDQLFPDTADIDAFLSVFSGGPCL